MSNAQCILEFQHTSDYMYESSPDEVSTQLYSILQNLDVIKSQQEQLLENLKNSFFEGSKYVEKIKANQNRFIGALSLQLSKTLSQKTTSKVNINFEEYISHHLYQDVQSIVTRLHSDFVHATQKQTEELNELIQRKIINLQTFIQQKKKDNDQMKSLIIKLEQFSKQNIIQIPVQMEVPKEIYQVPVQMEFENSRQVYQIPIQMDILRQTCEWSVQTEDIGSDIKIIQVPVEMNLSAGNNKQQNLQNYSEIKQINKRVQFYPQIYQIPVQMSVLKQTSQIEIQTQFDFETFNSKLEELQRIVPLKSGQLSTQNKPVTRVLQTPIIIERTVQVPVEVRIQRTIETPVLMSHIEELEQKKILTKRKKQPVHKPSRLTYNQAKDSSLNSYVNDLIDNRYGPSNYGRVHAEDKEQQYQQIEQTVWESKPFDSSNLSCLKCFNRQKSQGQMKKVFIQTPVIIQKIVQKVVQIPVIIKEYIEIPIIQQTFVEVPVIIQKTIEIPLLIQEDKTPEIINSKLLNHTLNVEQNSFLQNANEEKVETLQNLNNQEIQHQTNKENTKEKVIEIPVQVITDKQIQVPVEIITQKIIEIPVPVEIEKYVIVKEIQQIPVEVIVQKQIQVPVEIITQKIIEIPVPVEIEKYVIVKEIQQIPVEVIVQKFIQIPVQIIVQRIVQVYIDRPVYIQVPVEVYIQKPTDLTLNSHPQKTEILTQNVQAFQNFQNTPYKTEQQPQNNNNIQIPVQIQKIVYVQMPIFIEKLVQIPYEVIIERERIIQKPVIIRQIVEIPCEIIIQKQVQVPLIIKENQFNLDEEEVLHKLQSSPYQNNSIQDVQIPRTLKSYENGPIIEQNQYKQSQVAFSDKELIQIATQVYLQVPVQVIIEKYIEKYIEVPIQIQKIVYVDRFVEVPVEVIIQVEKLVIIKEIEQIPIEIIVQRYIEVPVEITIQKIVQIAVPVQVEKVVIVREIQEIPVEIIIDRYIQIPIEIQTERIVQIAVPVTVEVEKLVIVKEIHQIPIQIMVEKLIEVPVQIQIERIVQIPVQVQKLVFIRQIQQIPVQIIVQKYIEIPVQVYTQKIVQIAVPIQIQKLVFIKEIQQVPVQISVQKYIQIPVQIYIDRVVQIPVITNDINGLSSKRQISINEKQNYESLNYINTTIEQNIVNSEQQIDHIKLQGSAPQITQANVSPIKYQLPSSQNYIPYSSKQILQIPVEIIREVIVEKQVIVEKEVIVIEEKYIEIPVQVIIYKVVQIPTVITETVQVQVPVQIQKIIQTVVIQQKIVYVSIQVPVQLIVQKQTSIPNHLAGQKQSNKPQWVLTAQLNKIEHLNSQSMTQIVDILFSKINAPELNGIIDYIQDTYSGSHQNQRIFYEIPVQMHITQQKLPERQKLIYQVPIEMIIVPEQSDQLLLQNSIENNRSNQVYHQGYINPVNIHQIILLQDNSLTHNEDEGIQDKLQNSNNPPLAGSLESRPYQINPIIIGRGNIVNYDSSIESDKNQEFLKLKNLNVSAIKKETQENNIFGSVNDVTGRQDYYLAPNKLNLQIDIDNSSYDCGGDHTGKQMKIDASNYLDPHKYGQGMPILLQNTQEISRTDNYSNLRSNIIIDQEHFQQMEKLKNQICFLNEDNDTHKKQILQLSEKYNKLQNQVITKNHQIQLLSSKVLTFSLQKDNEIETFRSNKNQIDTVMQNLQKQNEQFAIKNQQLKTAYQRLKQLYDNVTHQNSDIKSKFTGELQMLGNQIYEKKSQIQQLKAEQQQIKSYYEEQVGILTEELKNYKYQIQKLQEEINKKDDSIERLTNSHEQLRKKLCLSMEGNSLETPEIYEQQFLRIKENFQQQINDKSEKTMELTMIIHELEEKLQTQIKKAKTLEQQLIMAQKSYQQLLIVNEKQRSDNSLRLYELQSKMNEVTLELQEQNYELRDKNNQKSIIIQKLRKDLTHKYPLTNSPNSNDSANEKVILNSKKANEISAMSAAVKIEHISGAKQKSSFGNNEFYVQKLQSLVLKYQKIIQNHQTMIQQLQQRVYEYLKDALQKQQQAQSLYTKLCEYENTINGILVQKITLDLQNKRLKKVINQSEKKLQLLGNQLIKVARDSLEYRNSDDQDEDFQDQE